MLWKNGLGCWDCRKCRGCWRSLEKHFEQSGWGCWGDLNIGVGVVRVV